MEGLFRPHRQSRRVLPVRRGPVHPGRLEEPEPGQDPRRPEVADHPGRVQRPRAAGHPRRPRRRRPVGAQALDDAGQLLRPRSPLPGLHAGGGGILDSASHQDRLSGVNRLFLDGICELLGITTVIRSTSEYELGEGRTSRLVELCRQVGATSYLSGPAAKAYIDDRLFADAGVELEYMDYSGYSEYPQLLPPVRARRDRARRPVQHRARPRPACSRPAGDGCGRPHRRLHPLPVGGPPGGVLRPDGGGGRDRDPTVRDRPRQRRLPRRLPGDRTRAVPPRPPPDPRRALPELRPSQGPHDRPHGGPRRPGPAHRLRSGGGSGDPHPALAHARRVRGRRGLRRAVDPEGLALGAAVGRSLLPGLQLPLVTADPASTS